MERIRQLLADVNRYFAQLTKRERLLVMFAGGSMVVFFGVIVFSSFSRSIARLEASIEEKEQALDQISVYSQGFAANERSRREMESRLGGQPLRLSSHLQGLADRHGLTVSSMTDRPESTTDQVVESAVDVQIAAAPIDKLTNLLNEVEKNQRIVKVKKLRVRRNSGDPKAPNVNLTVATYGLVKG